MKKPIIAVDVDDVIALNAEAFIEYSNDKFGTHLTANDYHDHWAELWKVDMEETNRRAVEYYDSGHMAYYKHIESAYEALELLKQDFTLVVLTARRQSGRALTEEWISKFYPGIFENITFTGFYDIATEGSIHLTKGELAKELGAEYLIDDQIKHVEAAVKIGIKGLLFGNYGWNNTETLAEGVVRVKDWDDILRYFGKYAQ